MMKATHYYLSKDSGLIDEGWLKSRYSFNFETMAEFEKIRFGQLRILNNDTIAGGFGFNMHAHLDMEIVTIVLAGGLKHKDSLGNNHEILEGEVQVMTAGTGIRHSEFNHFSDRPSNFLQIWVFPFEKGLSPKYDQRKFAPDQRIDKWDLLVAPNDDALLSINQDAYFSRASLSAGNSISHLLHQQGQGVLFYVIAGEIRIGDEIFGPGDAAGYQDTPDVLITAVKHADILAIEVPFTKVKIQ